MRGVVVVIYRPRGTMLTARRRLRLVGCCLHSPATFSAERDCEWGRSRPVGETVERHSNPLAVRTSGGSNRHAYVRGYRSEWRS